MAGYPFKIEKTANVLKDVLEAQECTEYYHHQVSHRGGIQAPPLSDALDVAVIIVQIGIALWWQSLPILRQCIEASRISVLLRIINADSRWKTKEVLRWYGDERQQSRRLSSSLGI